MENAWHHGNRPFLTALAFCSLAAVAWGQSVLIEAERFDDLGGWVPDCQFMDQMGSPFLLAHGLGRPVKDAVTTVALPAGGEYRLWVRTRDWVATWNAPGQPGRFQVVINGKPVKTVFGTEGAKWHWQDGGVIRIDAARADVALHDLTGFEGRCDAILLAAELNFQPPNKEPEMSAWRRQLLGIPDEPEEVGAFDLVVTGGGIAGTCAALAAARLGLKVALIQDRPVLGGNNSSEVRVWLQGARNQEPFPRVGDIVRELEQQRRAHYGPANTAELYEDERKLNIVRSEENITLLLNHRVNQVETGDNRILAVIAQRTITGERRRVRGRWFVDSTGDGCVGYLAGADYELTPRGHMGRCNLWNVIATDRPQPFPRCPWALDLAGKPFPGRNVRLLGVAADHRGPEALGGWYWESGFDHNPFAHSEYIRDWNFRAMYGAWDTLKNVDGRYPNYRLNWAAYVSGKRESRRLLGDIILTKEDVVSLKSYPDGCFPTGWPIDLHLPDKRYDSGFEGDAFIAKAHYTQYPRPYWVPYRCLYSRNITNLFMAGRDISVTHDALGTVRVMRTGGCMGEIVGRAAWVCKQHDADPRDVYQQYLDELIASMQRGLGRLPVPSDSLSPPEWLAKAGDNLALAATVAVSGSRDVQANPLAAINDGRIDLESNSGRWLSSTDKPAWIEFSWGQPQTISAARIVSGYNVSGQIVAPIRNFVIEAQVDGQWQPIEATRIEGNELVDWNARFAPVSAKKIRLQVQQTDADVARIWEVELYGVNDESAVP